MKFIGLYIADSNSNICYSDGSNVKYISFDRFYNSRNHGPVTFYQWKDALTYFNTSIEELDAIAIVNDWHDFDPDQLWDLLPEEERPVVNSCPTFIVDKHYAQSLSVWPVSEVDTSYIFDSVGNNSRYHSRFESNKLTNEVDANGAGSLYRYIQGIGTTLFREYNIADLYSIVTSLVPYGLIDESYSEKIKGIPFTNSNLLWDYDRWDKKWHNERFDLNWLKTCYEHNTNEIVKYIYENRADKISFCGALSEDSYLNYKLLKGGKDIVLTAHGNDYGVSLGAIEFLRRHLNADYKFDSSGYPFIQQDEVPEEISDHMIEVAADALVEDAIIGWYQGRGEIGNKSLGHRSILTPVNSNVSKHEYVLNSIKSKQLFQNYRVSVLLEDVDKHFDYNGEAPFGNVTVPVKDESLDFVTRPDGSVTIQTVDGDDCFAKLLRKYKEKTGSSVVLQTSLLEKGNPLANKKWQANHMLLNSSIDAMFIGNDIVTK